MYSRAARGGSCLSLDKISLFFLGLQRRFAILIHSQTDRILTIPFLQLYANLSP